MDVKLVVVGGEVKTTEIKLKLPTIVGRGKGAGVVLQHPLVSRQHCEIYEHEGQLAVRDLGSLNGTYINNTRLTEPTTLPSGELLTIGTVTFRAEYHVDPNLRPPAPTQDLTLNTAGSPTVKTEAEPVPDFMEAVDEALEEEVEVEEVEVVEETPEFVESVEEIEIVGEVEEVSASEQPVEAQEDDFLGDMLAVLDVEEVEELPPEKPTARQQAVSQPAPAPAPAPVKASSPPAAQPAPSAKKPQAIPEKSAQKTSQAASTSSSSPSPAPASQPSSRWVVPTADDQATLRARADEKAKASAAKVPKSSPKPAVPPAADNEQTIMPSPSQPTAHPPAAPDDAPAGSDDDDIGKFLAGLASPEKPEKPSASPIAEEAEKSSRETSDFLAAMGAAAASKVENQPLHEEESPRSDFELADAPAEPLAEEHSRAEPTVEPASSMFIPATEAEPAAEDLAEFPEPEILEEVPDEADSPVNDHEAHEELVAFEAEEEPAAPSPWPSGIPPVAEAAGSVELEEVSFDEGPDERLDETAPVKDIDEGAFSDDDFAAFIEPVSTSATEENVAATTADVPSTQPASLDETAAASPQPASPAEPTPVKPKKRPHAAPRFPFTPKGSVTSNSPPATPAATVEPTPTPSQEKSTDSQPADTAGSNGAQAAPWMKAEATAEEAEAKAELPASSGDESENVPIPLEAMSAAEAEAQTPESQPPAADSDDDLSTFLKNLGS